MVARKRFLPKWPESPTDLNANDDFSRFTPRAANAVVAAHNEAHTAGHAEILPAHLVLGLLSEPDTIAAQTLVATGLTTDAIQQAATAALPPPIDGGPELVPYGSAAKKVLELTFREALRLGHNYIGTEHIVLALVEVEDGDGVLSDLGVTKPALELHITTALARHATTEPPD